MDKKSYKYGFILIGTGQRYIEELINLVYELSDMFPEFGITVFSDQPNAIKEALVSLMNIKESSRVNFIRIKDPLFCFADKVRYIARSPYEKSFFLDTDIHIIGDITGLIDILDHFDIAAPYAPIDEVRPQIPSCFVEYNTGVVAFNRTAQVLHFFAVWEKLYMKDLFIAEPNDFPPDQPAFREALYNSKLRVATLPLEYNCMMDYPCFLSEEVKVLHGRRHKVSSIAKIINRYTGIRVYLPDIGLLMVDNGKTRIISIEETDNENISN